MEKLRIGISCECGKKTVSNDLLDMPLLHILPLLRIASCLTGKHVAEYPHWDEQTTEEIINFILHHND